MRYPHAATGLLVLVCLALGCEPESTAPTESAAFSHQPGQGSSPSARNFVAPLSHREEVPEPVLAETRNPTGNAKFRLSGSGTELSYKLIVANIRNVTQAHIHCGVVGEAGPVVAFLFGFVTGGVDVNGILAEGTVTPGDVIPRASSDVCPGGVASFADMIAQIRAGNAYVNVHTVQNPPGEIRGQIRTAGAAH